MSQSARPWIAALVIGVAAGLALVVWGLAAGNEPLLAVGLPVAFLSAILLPALFRRAAQQQKLLDGAGLLADWQYSPAEAEMLAGRRRCEVLRVGWRLALLLTFCTILILLPIGLSLREQTGAVPVPLALGGAVAVVLIWMAVPLAAAYWAGEVKDLPCRTRIGRHCLFVANRYHPLNDYHQFTLERARLVCGENGSAMLRIDCSYIAGKRLSEYRKTVDVPVPAGREQEAEKLIRLLESSKNGD